MTHLHDTQIEGEDQDVVEPHVKNIRYSRCVHLWQYDPLKDFFLKNMISNPVCRATIPSARLFIYPKTNSGKCSTLVETRIRHYLTETAHLLFILYLVLKIDFTVNIFEYNYIFIYRYA